MGQEIDYITVNYKNMERVAVPSDKVVDFDLYGITTSLGGYGTSLVEKRLEADYVLLIVGKYEDEDSTIKSDLYSNVTPYERLKQDKTVVSITLYYKDGVSEEIHVPYKSKNPEVMGDNELLDIEEGDKEKMYAETVYGLSLEFNKEERDA